MKLIYKDVEKELDNYKKYFKNKIVFINEGLYKSSIWKYFNNNFYNLELKEMNIFHSFDLLAASFITNENNKKNIIFISDGFENKKIFNFCFEKKLKFIILQNHLSIANENIFNAFKKRLVSVGFKVIKKIIEDNKVVNKNYQWVQNLVKTSNERTVLNDHFNYYNYDRIINKNDVSKTIHPVLIINKIKKLPAKNNPSPYLMVVPANYLSVFNHSRFLALGLLNHSFHYGFRRANKKMFKQVIIVDKEAPNLKLLKKLSNVYAYN